MKGGERGRGRGRGGERESREFETRCIDMNIIIPQLASSNDLPSKLWCS